MASRGGRKPGAGRPPTNGVAKAREIAKALEAPGLSPLEIMYSVMRELYEDAHLLERGTARRQELLEASVDVATRCARYVHAPKAAEDANGQAVQSINQINFLIEFQKSPNEPDVIDGVAHAIDLLEDSTSLPRVVSAK